MAIFFFGTYPVVGHDVMLWVCFIFIIRARTFNNYHFANFLLYYCNLAQQIVFQLIDHNSNLE